MAVEEQQIGHPVVPFVQGSLMKAGKAIPKDGVAGDGNRCVMPGSWGFRMFRRSAESVVIKYIGVAAG